MSLNETVSAERVHIGFFGLRNAGKSSLVNAVTGQSLSVVSDVKGTTTDPVKKAMELLPLGPVVIIDTPGMDDEGELGELRVKRARQVLRYTDIAVLVTDAAEGGLRPAERELVSLFQERQLPYVIAYNKCDLLDAVPAASSAKAQAVPAASVPENVPKNIPANEIYVSAEKNINIRQLKEMIGHLAGGAENQRQLVGDLIGPGDLVVLVVPIDKAAPKGRLILPQQQVLRDVLDSGAMAMVTRECELEDALKNLTRKPQLVITDSQVFDYVSGIVPQDIPLTSFSILMVRYKGGLEGAVHGAAQLDRLKDGDRVLISEGCTHHRQCEDIGTVKMPGWIRNYTGKNIEFEFTSGGEFPENLNRYALVVHCGGCMLNEKEMQYRTRHAAQSGVAMTNYGIAIAQMHGILRRSIRMFPAALAALEETE